MLSMKAFIFDCDGTLVDTEGTHFSAWKKTFERRGHNLSLDDYRPFVGTPSEIASKTFAKKFDIDSPDDLKNEKHNLYQEELRNLVYPIEETVNFLHRIVEAQKRLDLKLAVASGASKSEILTYLRALKIESFFSVILSGRDDLHHYKDPEGVNKPKPYIYLEAAKQLGLHPSECIAIEDSMPGVTASADAGCITIAIPTAFSAHQDFSKSDLLISSFKNYSVDEFLNEVKRRIMRPLHKSRG